MKNYEYVSIIQYVPYTGTNEQMYVSNNAVSAGQQVELNDPTVYLWECDEQDRVVLVYYFVTRQELIYNKIARWYMLS